MYGQKNIKKNKLFCRQMVMEDFYVIQWRLFGIIRHRLYMKCNANDIRGGADKSLARTGRKQAVLLGKKENKM